MSRDETTIDELRAALDDARRERDEALRRARSAAQTLIEEVGAAGPCDVEDAAARAVERLRDAREAIAESKAAAALLAQWGLR